MGTEKRWFNQVLLNISDKSISESTFRVSVVTSTDDFQYFSQPALQWTIINPNGYSKTLMMSIQQVEDLLESFEYIFENKLVSSDTVVEKTYNRKNKLYVRFMKHRTTGEPCVLVELYANETDRVECILRLKPDLQSVLRRVRFFTSHYDQICYDLMREAIHKDVNKVAGEFLPQLRSIPGQITEALKLHFQQIFETMQTNSQGGNQAPPSNSESSPPQSSDPSSDMTQMATEHSVQVPVSLPSSNMLKTDFDKFIGDDMKNVRSSDIENTLKRIEEMERRRRMERIASSTILEKTFRRGILSFENRMIRIATCADIFTSWKDDLDEILDTDSYPKLDEESYKSLVYLVKRDIDYHIRKLEFNDRTLPSVYTVSLYSDKIKSGEFDPILLEWSQEVLVTMLYMKLAHARLLERDSDIMKNGGYFYMILRKLCDNHIFTFLRTMGFNEFKTAVTKKAERLFEKGFFVHYDDLLKDHACKPIEIKEVLGMLDKIYEVMVNAQSVLEYHKDCYDEKKYRVPPRSLFDIEQIVDEVVKVEIDLALGAKLDDERYLETLKQLNIADGVISFFKNPDKVYDPNKGRVRRVPSLLKFLTSRSNDIPEDCRNAVLEFVKNKENEPIDLEAFPWPLEKFDEDIVKALYTWNPIENPKMQRNYSYFRTLVARTVLKKHEIISLMNKRKKERSEGSEADNVPVEGNNLTIVDGEAANQSGWEGFNFEGL